MADMSFASNLLGAVVGGAIEYVALVTGYQFLLIIVAALYALAWLFATRLRLGQDKELESESQLEQEGAARLGKGPGATPRRRAETDPSPDGRQMHRAGT